MSPLVDTFIEIDFMDKLTQIKKGATLDDLINDPSLAKTFNSEQAIDLLSGMASIQPILLAVAYSGKVENKSTGDRLLDIKEVADRLSCKVDWLYRQSKYLPFACKLLGQLRFSEKGLEKYMKNLPD